ncbi:hypothetical protein DB346_09555 [Verrucomicrobia bacterium LW23]|nr:hypothetical protein DB346_09555 [Verrucomicrobia bacterium LW23]
MKPTERAFAGLWGSVIGDALGVPVEFQSRARLDADPVTDMRSFGSHNQPPGTWSDDTSMMLGIIDSLLERDVFDTEDIAKRFIRWYRDGEYTPHGRVFDIGGTTAQALTRYEQHRVPAEQAGMTGEHSNGNGALMRTLPLALAYSHLPAAEMAERVERVASITHGHAVSRMSCVHYCLVARRVMSGQPLEGSLHAANLEFAELYRGRPEELYLPRFHRLLDASILTQPRSEIQSSGYTIHTLEAAIWCTHRAATFEEAVLAAVNLGEDTDTTGMVTGGLAAMIHGIATPEVRNWARVIVRTKDLQGKFKSFISKMLETQMRTSLYEKFSRLAKGAQAASPHSVAASAQPQNPGGLV